jgi:hypothetical protein
MIGKSVDYLKVITEFSDWYVATNIETINLNKFYYNFEDFVKNNEHIIQKINHQKQASS